MTFSKVEIMGTSVVTRGSNRDAQKMKGTTTHSQKLDSLEAGAMAILQQNWRDGRRFGKRRGESEEHGS